MIVSAVCALPHTKKTFETNLTKIGLPAPVGNGYTKTVRKTVLSMMTERSVSVTSALMCWLKVCIATVYRPLLLLM